jgi:quinoprotein glucose dehydrogenase
MGVYRPIIDSSRKGSTAATALEPAIDDLLKNGTDTIRIAAAEAAGALQVKAAGKTLFALVGDNTLSGKVRIAALNALATLKDKQLNAAIQLATKSTDVGLRVEANRLLGAAGGKDAVKQLTATLAKGSVSEKQSALAALSYLKDPDAQKTITKWANDLAAGKVAPELQLDVIEAAANVRSPAVSKALTQFESKRGKDDLAAYREVLRGGNAEAGRKIFFERADAQCLRCHKMKGEGSEVGPELTTLGQTKPREYLLEAIVYPNKAIAQGFDSIMITLKDDSDVSGVLRGETADEVTVAQPGGVMAKVKKSDIASRRTGLSGMPEGFGQLLSKRDLRDLVEYLATVK